MLRSPLLRAPVLLLVLLMVHGSDPSSTATAQVATAAAPAPPGATRSFALPTPPRTEATTTLAPTTTTTLPPVTTVPPATEAPTTAVPETAPPTDPAQTTPPETEAPDTSAPKPRRTTTTPPTTAPPETEATEPPAVTGDVAAVIDLTNAERAAAGLGPVTANRALEAAAARENDDIAAQGTLSHTGSDGSTVATRASDAGYEWRTVGENIAVGFPDPSSVMTAWMESPGHRANILNGDFEDIGVAVATGAGGRRYWTMVLGA